MDTYIRKPLKVTLDALFEGSDFTGYCVYGNSGTTKVVLNVRHRRNNGSEQQTRQQSNIDARYRRVNSKQRKRDTNRSYVRFHRFNNADYQRVTIDTRLDPDADSFSPCPVPRCVPNDVSDSPPLPDPPVSNAPVEPDLDLNCLNHTFFTTQPAMFDGSACVTKCH